MQHATTAASTEKTDGPPTPQERVTGKVLQNWGWLHQHDVEGVLGILDELRLRRGVSPEMATAEAELQRYYEGVSSMLPTVEDGGFGRETLSKLDSAHGHLMNLYEERGFRLGLAVAAALRDTEDLAEVAPTAETRVDRAAQPAEQREDAGSAQRRRARVVQTAEALRESLSDLSRDIAEVSVDLDETMTLVLTRGIGRAALRARELTVAASQ